MINKITKMIEEWDKIVLFHHVQIDGDSLSSSYGLMRSLQKKFPNKTIKWVVEKDFAKERFSKLDIDYSDSIEDIDESWLAIVGDVAVLERIYKGKELIHKAGARIVFDHHKNECDIPNVDVFWHEPTWPAASIQAYEIAKHLKVEFDSHMAIMILYGIITDTGRFLYSLTNQEALKASYELFEFINDEDLQNMYEGMNTRSLKDIEFQAHVLSSFKIKEKVAYFTIDKKKQEEMGLTPDDCARVNTLMGIEGINIWLFFIEYPDFIRVEFRSNGPAVNEIAMKFGGGGHIKAAGCHLEKMEDYIKVVKECVEATK